MQCVPSNIVICIGGEKGRVSAESDISVLYLKLQLLVAMAAATGYNDIPLSSSTAMLYYMSVFHPLLRSPAHTHVLLFNCLSLLHFQLQLPMIHTFQTC